MHDYINETVEVTVDFKHPRVRPVAMRWNHREYPLQHVNLVHTTRHGEKRYYFFAVSDDALNNYRLRFDTDTLEWKLMELWNASYSMST